MGYEVRQAAVCFAQNRQAWWAMGRAMTGNHGIAKLVNLDVELPEIDHNPSSTCGEVAPVGRNAVSVGPGVAGR